MKQSAPRGASGKTVMGSAGLVSLFEDLKFSPLSVPASYRYGGYGARATHLLFSKDHIPRGDEPVGARSDHTDDSYIRCVRRKKKRHGNPCRAHRSHFRSRSGKGIRRYRGYPSPPAAVGRAGFSHNLHTVTRRFTDGEHDVFQSVRPCDHRRHVCAVRIPARSSAGLHDCS